MNKYRVSHNIHIKNKIIFATGQPIKDFTFKFLHVVQSDVEWHF